MGKKLILIMFNSHFSQEQINNLEEIAFDYRIKCSDSNDVTDKDVGEAEVIFGWPSLKQIRKAKKLNWLQLPSAGSSGFVDQSIYQNKNIILTNASGVFGMPIAEHVFAMILAFNKNLFFHFKNIQKSNWKRMTLNKDAWGTTFGIIGLGNIGKEVAKRAHDWEAKVIAVKRTPGQKPDYVDNLYSQEKINTVLKKSDYVILSLPQTPETRGIISEERLKKMKEEAFIINVGRGTAIDQKALINALKERWIAGAALDVTDPEPLPETNPLWNLDNVIITSHSAGLSLTNKERWFKLFKENLHRYISGESLKNLVDFNTGY